LAIGGKAGYGGHRRFAFELITRVWGKSQGDVLIIAQKVVGFPEDIKFIEGVSLNSRFIKNYFKIRSVLKNYDIVHALDGWPSGVIGYLLTFGLKTKLLITAEGTGALKQFNDPWRGFLLKRSYIRANALTAISRYTSTNLRKHLQRTDIEIVNHGVDTDKFNDEHVCNEFLKEVKTLSPYILSVGDVRDRKGYHISIPVFKKLTETFSDLNYVVVGYQDNNEYVRDVRNMISKMDLQNRVHLLQDIPDEFLVELYSHANLFMLLPVNINHEFEGFGLVFLEAARKSVPAITTKDNGSEDAVVDGKTGFVVPQSDVDATVEVAKKILSDNELRSKLGANARNFAQTMGWENIIEKYFKIYRRLNV
jgi:glycosyltransferase involved in cell wall biosynthesis